MSNILLVNDNVQDYQIIINACNDITYAITYNQKTDTYDTIFTKYEELVSENNIQVLNHLALVSHGSTSQEFIFLEKENKMLISKYFEDLSFIVPDTMIPSAENVEDVENETSVPEDISSDSSSNSMNRFIINNLDTWTTFKEFIKKFNIQISLDFLGCALLQSADWKYVLETLETEQHLHLTIRASDDATGNLKVGGDWVLESDNVNIKELYFNGESINTWNYKLSTYNFTNLNGGSSYTGPTSASGYNGTNLQGVTVAAGIQNWTVPTTGSYSIEAWGASGGDGRDGEGTVRYGGVGRYVKITTTLTQGESIYILVGQGGTRTYIHCGSGGGGSFVTKVKPTNNPQNSDILVIAGGGGGGGKGYSTTVIGQSPQINARSVGSQGGYSYDYHTGGGTNSGGLNGNGGQSTGSRKTQGSAGGGGFFGDGATGYGSSTLDVGKSFNRSSGAGEGGKGSISGSNYGGFGGGGSQPHQNHVGGGGGGGYNGGAPGGNYNGAWSGGGGSSYALGTPDIDEEWTDNRTGAPISLGRHGKVTITHLVALTSPLYPFTTHTFTTGGQSSNYKHLATSLSAYQSSYSGSGFESNTSYFNVINGIQLWIVPITGTYLIEVAGGGGGSTYINNRIGGAGRVIRGTVDLTVGNILRIIVGSRGGRFQYTAGGGGASAVGPGITMSNASTPSGTTGRWIIAGAGGGGGDSGGNGKNASTGETADAGWAYGGNTSAGTGGRSGTTSNGGWGGGGAGWTSDGGGNSNTGSGSNYQGHYNARKLNDGDAPNGAYYPFTYPFIWSSSGSCKGAAGGFGGGGNGGCNGAGAGAGYTGGNAGGAGGSSYFNTTAMTDRVDVGTNTKDTDGYVKITLVPGDPPIPTSDISLSILKNRYNISGSNANQHANLTSGGLYNFSTHTFTNCGETGPNGPELSDCTSAYAGYGNYVNSTNFFNVIGEPGVNGIQVWTVPDTGEYDVDAYGAIGGGTLGVPGGAASGGTGARIAARFSFTIGDKYMILCGQKGGPGTNTGLGSSGGGGTFFVKGDDYSNVTLEDVMLVAGGGGGRGATGYGSNGGGGGVPGSSNSTTGGGDGAYGSGGGGGLLGNGEGNGHSIPQDPTGGYSFKNGGKGGTPGNYTSVSGQYGGFGGGGGASVHAGSGAGGIYGGDGADPYNANPNGKGGGSHYKGTLLVSNGSQGIGDGKIIITAVTAGGGSTRQIYTSDIKLSYFSNATFKEGDPVPTSNISIDTHFKGRTFGAPPSTILGDLMSLAQTLNNYSVSNSSNLDTAVTSIHEANDCFNVFAIVGYQAMAEMLTGTYHNYSTYGRPRVEPYPTTPTMETKFYYNNANNNYLGYGGTIENMTGGSNNNLSQIDGKKWMAMAMYSGTSFKGILVWVFTGGVVNSSGTLISSRSHSTVRSIFHPEPDSDYYAQIHPIVIGSNGVIIKFSVNGSTGWIYSNNQQPVSAGYKATNKFSADDGCWGFMVEGRVDGNHPGPYLSNGSSSNPTFGIINPNSGDTQQAHYWNYPSESIINNANYVGFVFSGDFT